MIKRLWQGLIVGCLLVGVLTGCTQINDHLTLNADGSGSVVIETTVAGPIAEMGMMYRGMMLSEGGAGLLYPPLSEEEAEQLFPGDAFIVTFEQNEGDDDQQYTVNVQFSNVNALLGSPYGEARALAIHLDQQAGQLTVLSRTGLDGLLAMEAAAASEDNMLSGQLPLSPEQVEQIKQKQRYSFTVTLPNAVSAEGASNVDGSSATWVISRKDAATPEAYVAGLRSVMQVSCPAEGITFQPKAVARLNLLPFDQLSEQTESDESAASVDTQQVLDSYKLTPLVVSVRRTFDLAGGSWGGDNQAMVVAMINLSREHEPLRWGEFEMSQAVDDLGNSLMLDDEERRYRHSYMDLNENWGMMGDEEEKAVSDVLTRYITAQLKTPPIEAKTIAHLTGSVKIYYGGSDLIVKLPNAIASVDGSDPFSMRGDEQGYQHPTFTQYHLKVIQDGLYKQSEGMIAGSLRVEGKDAVITGMQVFDRDGQPWPTMISRDRVMGDTTAVQFAILGNPQAPLSLALRLNASGASVTLPVDLSDLPLTQPNDADERSQ